ncbi:MAG TPA: hypothetical protein V6D17_22455 [Candidatus Obscuribacterales bacterium]
MALSKFFTSGSAPLIRLSQMNYVPTTEDLNFALTIAKKHRKTVELPFKHPNNGLSFAVKVSPPQAETKPIWVFVRGNEAEEQELWTRETNEIIMVQGKIKIESQYTGIYEQAECTPITLGTPLGMGSLSSSTTLEALPPVKPEQETREPQRETPSSCSQSDSFTNLPARFVQGVDPYTLNPPEPLPFAAFAGGKPNLPEPHDFSTAEVEQLAEYFLDANTGLLSYQAFVFFLMREHCHFEKFGNPLSLLSVSLRLLEGDEETPLPKEFLKEVAENFIEICAPPYLFTYLGEGNFALLLGHTNAEEALDIAKTLHSALIGQANGLNYHIVADSVAIGIANIPQTCIDPATLFSAAHAAREEARNLNRPYLMFP